VTATFSLFPAVTHTLTVAVAGQGTATLDPPGGVYAAGTPVTLTATPEAGWNFAGWSGDLSTANLVEHLTLDADRVVTATFTQQPVVTHTLTVAVVGQGAVVPQSGVYVAGSVITLAATPGAGWHFDGWTGALITTNAVASLTMDADKSVTATFIQTNSPFLVYLPLVLRDLTP